MCLFINGRWQGIAALLVFANKQDLANALTAADVTEKLGLHNVRNRQWLRAQRRAMDFIKGYLGG